MMSVKDFFLGIVSLALWPSALANTRNLQLYEQTFTSYDLRMQYFILHTSSSVSYIFCSAWCINNQTCVSFMFDAEISKCRTFSNYVQCESVENMQRFYVKTGHPTCDCNVSYNSSFVNVALRKPVTQISTYRTWHHAELMVDGDRITAACTHTRSHSNPYAIIDLQQSYNVFSFYIENTAGHFYWRLHDLRILVGNDPLNLSVCIDYPYTIGKTCALRVPTLCQGRFVKLQLNAKEFLSLCEVEVYSIM